MNRFCQIEHVDSDSDIGSPCSNHAVAQCADCGAAICAAVERGAAGIRSANHAVITTLRMSA